MNDTKFIQFLEAHGLYELGHGDVLSYTNHESDASYTLTDVDMVDVSHDQIAAISRMGD